jgi:phosphate/sulfate permease
VGFVLSAALLLLMKFLVRRPELYSSPKGNTPPPLWIRGLLVLTCTGVSFAHGSNDGQKGMGLIMLILIGVVPTVYALNRAMPPSQMQEFVTTLSGQSDGRGGARRTMFAPSAPTCPRSRPLSRSLPGGIPGREQRLVRISTETGSIPSTPYGTTFANRLGMMNWPRR